MPESSALHIDAVLSNLSIQYINEQLIWPFLMPQIKVGKRSDKYYQYNKADTYKIPNDQIGPTAMPNEHTWGLSNENYSVVDHALGDWLAQEAIDNSDNPLQPEIDTNDFLNLWLELAQEQRVANKVFAAATYPSGNKVQLSGNDQWGGSTDDPIDDITEAIEACFVRANTLVFGQAVWKKFRKLSEILDAVKGTSRYQGSPGGLATAPEVAGLFEVDRVLVGRARYNSAKEGQTPSYARLWGKHCAALYVAPSPGAKSITFGLTISEMLKQTQRDFDKKRGIKGAHYFKVAWNSDEKIIASDVGYLIEDAVA